jgi:FixJ family two-component response regulator
VLDTQLGAMSGVELAKRLAADGGRISIVFITAHDDPEARAKLGGCAAYFRKTTTGSEMLEAIRRLAV